MPLPDGVHPLPLTEEAVEAFAPFDRIIGDARFVGLGEAIHTSGGLYEAKAALIRHLVVHDGFRALAIETPWHAAQEVNRYVQTCTGDPTEAITGMFRVFHDVSTVELLVDLCEWNQANPHDRVQVYGFDVQHPMSDLAVLRAMMERAPELDEARQGLDACPGATLVDMTAWYAWRRENTVTEPEDIACLKGLETLDLWLAGRAEPLTRVAAASLRGWHGEVMASQRGDERASDVARDAAMTEVLLRLGEHVAPGARTVVWAHDVHLSWGWEHASYAPTPRGESAGFRSLGTHLAERLGANWVPIAITAWRADIDWLDTPRPGPGAPRSLEAWLHRLDDSPLIVDLAVAEVAHERARRWGPMRGGWSYWVVPRQQWRAVVYLDRSRAALPTWAIRSATTDELRARMTEGVSWTYREPRRGGPALEEAWARLLRVHGWESLGGGRWRVDGVEFEFQLRWEAISARWRARLRRV